MQIISNEFNSYKTKIFFNNSKQTTFTGIKAAKRYASPIIKTTENIPIESIKNKLLQKVSQINKIYQNLEVKRCSEYMIKYATSLEQLVLINLILEKEFFQEEETISQIKNVIYACKSPAKINFVTKIFNNENLYKNKNLLSKLESILYSFDSKACNYEPKIKASSYRPKDIVLNKILSSEKLYQNKGFMDNLGLILYNTEDHVTAYKTENILEAVLGNESLSNDEKFIEAIGEIFSIVDIAKYANTKVYSILKNFADSPKQFYLLKSITNILGTEACDVLTQKVIKNEKLLNDNDFLSFLPDIIYSINGKTYQKSNEIINYIKKNKTKNENFNKELISEYMQEPYESISKAETFIKMKFKAFEKKERLANPFDMPLCKIDTFFKNNKQNILSAIELLGEKNFIHAFSLKISGLKELCIDCQTLKNLLNKDYYENLLLKINPHESKQYKELEKKISDLKKFYPIVKKLNNPEKLKKLENDIDTITKQSRDILANKLNCDPDTIIEKIRIISGFFDNKDDINSKDRNQKCYELINLLQDSTPENDKTWKEFCNKMIFKKIVIDYDPQLAEKLNFINSKYISKIVVANIDFLIGLREIVLLIKDNPNKTITEIFNELPSNKITKSEFEKRRINYEKWINYDENSSIKIKDENDRIITIKKVNMNNISKALFLGNEASCCTKVGNGTKQATATTYIKNKLIGAIEMLDNETPIGNTMCYFAEVENQVALILDNVELLPDYKEDNCIRDGLIKYAEKLCEEVGKPNIPIYVVGHRNEINLDNQPNFHYLKPIGNTGKDSIYFDFLTTFSKVEEKSFFDAELTRVK